MYVVAKKLLVRVGLAALLVGSPGLAGRCHSVDLAGGWTAYLVEVWEALTGEDLGNETRTCEANWAFEGTAVPEPEGPNADTGPVPEDPIP